MGLVMWAALALPASAAAQGFPDHRAAAVDQYGEPTPTPTPEPTPAPTQSGNGNGAGNGGGSGEPGKTTSREDDEGAGVGGDGSGRSNPPGTAPDSGPGVAGERAGDVVPLADSKGGRLPFTGLDLLTIALIGCALIAAGSLLALATRRRRSGDGATA